jgi:hypothetical protein
VKRIFSSHNLQVVHHARNLLEAAGIRAAVRNEYLGSAMGELPPAECEFELWVLSEADVLRAEEVLQASESGTDWRCGCGETLGAQFTACWRCGTPRAA